MGVAGAKALLALAGVAQWIECWPANQGVMGLMPTQDTCLGCWPHPQLRVHSRQPHIDVSLPLFLSPIPLSLKMNRIYISKSLIEED